MKPKCPNCENPDTVAQGNNMWKCPVCDDVFYFSYSIPYPALELGVQEKRMFRWEEVDALLEEIAALEKRLGDCMEELNYHRGAE